jgi:nitroreductase
VAKPTTNFVDEVIKRRRTEKVLAIGNSPPQLKEAEIKQFDELVFQAVDVAGWAPFHYDRKKDGLAEPWRFTIFKAHRCREIAKHFFDWFTDIKPNNKLPKMLNACGALVLITWLPETEIDNPKIGQVNEEHLAAAAAATQNLLLALESRELGTYWSSGGQLGSPEFFQRFDMNPAGRLIAAIFVRYPGLLDHNDINVISGKNREKRSQWQNWTQVID